MKEVAEVVILDIKPYSESSLWVCFFSKKFGLQNGIIKGGKKKKVKPLILGLYEASFFRWSNTGLQNVNGLERSEALEGTYNSPVKILVAFFVAESIKSFLSSGVEDPSFFFFIKEKILLLNNENRIKEFPIHFLSELISYSGHKPLKGNVKTPSSFDITTGVFNPKYASSKTVNNQDVVRCFYSVFYGPSILKNGIEHLVFDLLLDYCNYHLPGYDSKKSVNIIRETLYS